MAGNDSGYDPMQYIQKAGDWLADKESKYFGRKRSDMPTQRPQTPSAPSGLELLGKKAKDYATEKVSEASDKLKKYVSK